jgi:hypothetical protein
LSAAGVLNLGDGQEQALRALLGRYGLGLRLVPAGAPIPGSWWGDREAGLRGAELHARGDTPVHSVLHEACHYVCMAPGRRAALDTDAGGDYAEENGVCYLQVLLATSSRRWVGPACSPTWMPGGIPSGWARRAPGSRPTRRTRASGCAAMDIIDAADRPTWSCGRAERRCPGSGCQRAAVIEGHGAHEAAAQVQPSAQPVIHLARRAAPSQ